MTTDEKIAGLRNGGTVLISQSNGVKVFAERSGNGKTLRFVREQDSTQTVFKTCRY